MRFMSRFLATGAAFLLAATSVRLHAQQADASKSKKPDLPLTVGRHVNFTTSEGTWISLDVSPDGRAIVFDLLGDLYTLPIGGGTATRITSGPAFDAQPRWSPNGRRIVFTSDRTGSENVWVVEADGSHPRAVSKGEKERFVSPTWTPDGNYVIASRGSDLWLYHQDGGSGIKLTGTGTPTAPAGPNAPALRYLGAAFGGDARYPWVTIAQPGRSRYQTGRDDDRAPAEPNDDAPASSPRLIGVYQIGRLDRETGLAYVRSQEVQGAARPVPSPDGHWLVFAARKDGRTSLKLRDLTNDDERVIVADAQPDDEEASASRDAYP